MYSKISPKVFLAAVCLLSVSGFAQKGKPNPCPSPTPPTTDTICFSGSGCLDPALGTNGPFLFRPKIGNVTDIGIQKAVVQPDGKIVGAGQVFDSARTTHRDFFVIRVDASGQLDTTFGDTDPANPTQRLGYLIDQIGVSATPADAAYSLAYSAYDGKIVVSGSSDSASVIVRYTSDGRRDLTFGSNGIVRPGVALQAMDVAVQSDGKIVANLWDRFTAIRLNADGSFDSSFGSGGIAAYDASATAYGTGSARTMAIQTIQTGSGPEERIVLAGTGYDATTRKQQSSAVNQFALMRLRSNGAIDTTFGSGGRVKTGFFGLGDSAFDVHVDQDNKIVAGGIVAIASCDPDRNKDAGVARYSENGAFDWKATVDFYGYTNWIYGITTQVVAGDVKVVGIGMSGIFSSPKPDLGVFRLNSDGTPDASFGPGTFGPGKVTTNLMSTDHGLGGVVDAANNIVVVGSSSTGSSINATITRYFP